ncbi:hypothetical protein [Citrobacter freundii]|uniref:hypothetical protein n=1 Tax=Citrobacter freundii TaxID=546 RepID=UPI00207C4DE2|nr:hypothetical protein [Citrobacter freundii]MCO4147838.1 hypothetical protein [Citrobacter freundii]MCO4175942.1 hypothetical protein [Citrobacter freundii]
MDYVIAAALLPQDKLWTVEYSWKMVEAITPEIPQIEDETELIELIRHAWLWDKNAMIQGRCEQVPDMRSCLSSGAMEQGSL